MPATFLFSAFKLDLALECRLQKGRKFAKEFFSYEVSSETHKRLKKERLLQSDNTKQRANFRRFAFFQMREVSIRRPRATC